MLLVLSWWLSDPPYKHLVIARRLPGSRRGNLRFWIVVDFLQWSLIIESVSYLLVNNYYWCESLSIELRRLLHRTGQRLMTLGTALMQHVAAQLVAMTKSSLF